MKKRAYSNEAIVMIASLFCILICVLAGLSKPRKVYAADDTIIKTESQYIRIEEFIYRVTKKLGIEVNGDTIEAYCLAASEAEILTVNMRERIGKEIMLEEAAIILARADEYRYGLSVSDDTVELVLQRRITDIEKVTEENRVWFAKAYAMGYIAGSSDGRYSTSRTFKPGSRVKTKTADAMIKRISRKKLRYRLSPDYQICRISKRNMPKYTKYYRYILDSFPNAYYDWEFSFMRSYVSSSYPVTAFDKAAEGKTFNWWYYAAPADVNELLPPHAESYKGRKLEELLKERWFGWEQQISEYLTAIFNVDYRTIDKDDIWKEKIYKLTRMQYFGTREGIYKKLEKYLSAMKDNKASIECRKVSMDMGTFYVEFDKYYVRCYVEYKVNSAKSYRGELDSLVFVVNGTAMDLTNYLHIELGKWQKGYFDVEIDMRWASGIISGAYINDGFHHANFSVTDPVVSD